jgi:CRP-like cAMP-binding protein
MPTARQDIPAINRLLAALPKKEYKRLLPELERVPLTFGDILYEPGQAILHVYFPNDSIISLLTTVEGEKALEVGIVGNEGMAGVPALLGVSVSHHRALVQGAGTAMRMTAAVLRRETKQDGPLQRLLQRYTHSLLMQISQSAACNRFHLVDARLARWLLMASDRLQLNDFYLKQEFMANMLGVRREGVSMAAGALQRQELISYIRGHLKITNRAGLEAVACQCYMVIRDESDSFLNNGRA